MQIDALSMDNRSHDTDGITAAALQCCNTATTNTAIDRITWTNQMAL